MNLIKKKMGKNPTVNKYNKADLIYDANHSFYKYPDIKKIKKLFFKSKCLFLVDFFNE